MRLVFSARPAWAEVNLDHIIHNVRQFIKLIGPNRQLMAVVKADGYGHGAAAVAKTALDAGAACLAVAFVEEGIELRRSGIKAPILIFGYTDPVQFSALVEYKLTPTIFSFNTALQFSRLAMEYGIKQPLHFKIDTGMGRIGLLPEEAVEVITRITMLPGLEIKGIYTHLAAADEEDQSYTGEQLVLFDRIVERCRERGIFFPFVHAANSAAAAAYPQALYNLVRLGISLYGCYPSPGSESDLVELLPALILKSRVILVKRVPAGTAISYGCSFYTREESLVATVSIGYADGFSRLLSNRGAVLVRGRRAPIIGRVCMDHLMINVSHIPGVHQGDEVVLYGRQGENYIPVEEAAALVGTINYELLCAINVRVPRFYFKSNRLVAIKDYFGALEISD